MSNLLLVATRKGLFILEHHRGAWEIQRQAFLGDPVSLAVADPRSGRIYAALKLGHFGVKLHVSDDGGTSWRETACPAFPKSEEKDAPSVLEIWALEPGGAARTIWAGTIGGGLFRSDDAGENWLLVDSLWEQPDRRKWFGGGNDAPGIHSI